ncbi:MAG: dihydroorotase family protein [Candidatus Bipolaricaulota bacterium]|nr:dihydroorotase family protein [Candidatus Bipolaricaulota bacterium]MCS7273834.1 dihydroorotase family protein [Candidatus Bipolaricaulota bacterium]MDW8110748.1 dihydroorotase family protein [Candidatus Bipolaricaulota bacterium]MDW8328394.1 dihydroorotase family protein [Candidatus Bipolaricaulota bacterium]
MTILRNATVFVDGQLRKTDIAFDEKIRAIGSNLSGDEQIDCSGRLILPGGIDVHVHARDLNQSHKEDWASLGRAAVSGGVTTVCAMPNTDPPLDRPEIVRAYRERAASARVNAKIYGGITRDNIGRLEELARDVDAFKLYLGETTGNLVITDRKLHREIFKGIAQTGKLLAVHAQRGGPPKTVTRHEADDIHYVLDLAAAHETKLHLVHVTTRRGVEAIVEAKRSKVDVTLETCPQYLFFTERDREQRGAWLKMNPPLATEEDREFLWWALAEGLIDIVATDHAPHTQEEKSVGYERAPAGVPGVEFMLVLLLNAVNAQKLSLKRLVEVCCANPAKRFGLPTGELSVGRDADITVIDMNIARTITRESVRSKCGWSPYEGLRVQGWPVMTFVKGRAVYP